MKPKGRGFEMSKISYNRVYYWRNGKWNTVYPNCGISYSSEPLKSVHTLRAEVIRMGYPAVLGNSRIGPPEGPPNRQAGYR